MNELTLLNRRTFLAGSAAAASAAGLFPAWAMSMSSGVAAKGSGTLAGNDLAITVAQHSFNVDGRVGQAVAMNGTIPGPLVRLKEGESVRIAVHNQLGEDTSIHWHGLLVPFQMDGVPGVSFPGIKAHSTFVYEFPVRQSGTYWYHSHSGLQEQVGHYGPIIIDPAGPDPVAYDREHVILLSDWTFLHPHALFTQLKKQPGIFNRQKLTLEDRIKGRNPLTAEERAMFARMRMDPTDISDVTAAAYKYLINGHTPGENWTGLFRPGERVRLRIINAAAQTIFNLRIPGLPMTVVATDGVDVRTVEVDELQIGNAETYDVIVQPADRAYTFVAETIDRSGMGVATLAPREGMRSAVPPLRERREDIPELANHFLTRFAAERRITPPNLSDEAVAALQAHDWPGNVRQLRNIIERTVILAPGDRVSCIDVDLLPSEILDNQGSVGLSSATLTIMGSPLREARESFEREYLKIQIRRFSGNISRTASFIGMERSALHRKLKALGIADKRDGDE